ncbi:hypothetical protein ACI2L1_25185 [Streptomyces sp. NPDC019531]
MPSASLQDAPVITAALLRGAVGAGISASPGDVPDGHLWDIRL